MKKLLIILVTIILGFGQINPVRISDKACLSADKALDPANQKAEPYNGVNWDIEIVDSIHASEGGIAYASLKLDSLTSPQIAYYQIIETYNDTGWAKVIYSYNISNEWVKETVDSSFGYGLTNYYMYPTLCLDRYDNPHIAYIHRREDNSYHLHYTNKLSGNWEDTILATSVRGPTIALDTNNYPCIACTYKDPADTVWYTKYIYWNGVSWDSSVIDDGNNLSDVGPSLAIDGKNNPHIAYYQACDPLSDSVKYVYWDGANWVFAWAESIFAMSEHGSLSLALDTFDHPHIAYCIWPGLYYSFYDGILWHTEGPIDGASYEIRLDLDSLSLPHIVYIDQMICHPTYCYRDSVAWHLCGWVEPDTGVITMRSVSFCLDDESKPHVAYVGSYGNGDYKMKYAKGTFVSVEETRNKIPEPRYALQVYPNPSRGIANIDYALHEHSDVELSVYDVTGARVKNLKKANLVPGYYQEKIDVSKLSNGVYFIVLRQGDEKTSKKLVLVR